MHEEDGGEGALTVGGGEQRVHRAARPVDERVLQRNRPGRCRTGRCEDDIACAGADDDRFGAAGPGVLDRAVRPCGGSTDGAGRGLQRDDRAVQPDAVQRGAAARLGDDQDSGTVGVPVGVEIALDRGQVGVPLLACRRVDDEGERSAVALVHGQQSRVGVDRGEGHRVQTQAFAVVALPDDLAVHGEHAQRPVAGVAVLGVLEHQQPLVARHAGEVGVVLAGVEDSGRPISHDVDARPVVGRAADDDDVPADLEPCRVGSRDPGRGLDVGAAPERLLLPDAELVPVGVVEPPDLLAVRGQRTVAGAVRTVGDLPVHVGVTVPGVELEGAGRVRDVEAAGGRVLGPVGQGDAGGSEALLPEACGGRGRGHPTSLPGPLDCGRRGGSVGPLW